MDQQKLADKMNQHCFCIELEEGLLNKAIESLKSEELIRFFQKDSVLFFSRFPVFLSDSYLQKIKSMIATIEKVVSLPAFQNEILREAPQEIQRAYGPAGVFFGYDFHIGAEGPKLIEINTNAGGGLLNSYFQAAYKVCCDEVCDVVQPTITSKLQFEFFEMFQHEWALFQADRPLRTIALVDEKPKEQFLYPEFLLFQELFQEHGLKAFIVSPEELVWKEGQLWFQKEPIDMVYNRLTDFLLEQPSNRDLWQAFESNRVCFTPHPRIHALFANKQNLVRLSDPFFLEKIDCEREDIDVLVQGIPKTHWVASSEAEFFWKNRKQFFFKPSAGYGSKGTYRGAKLTSKKWEEIIEQGDYVAQEMVEPSLRTIQYNGEDITLKVDIRAFTYQGKIQLLAARLYQGQTTNFRTMGGGFAGVFSLRSSTQTMENYEEKRERKEGSPS